MLPIRDIPYQILAPDGVPREYTLLKALNLAAEEVITIYRRMILTRVLAVESERRARLNHVTIVISPMGQEAAEIASAYALPSEIIAYLYGRSFGVAIGREISPKSVADGFSGNPDPGSIADFIEHNTELPYVTVSAQIPPAVGAALASKILEKKVAPSIAYFGDGATAEGFFHSGMNWAAIFRVPVIFFCENNQRAISTPVYLQTPTETFAERALGYRMAWMRVDGNDPFAVYYATKLALEYVYQESRPIFIEAVTDLLTDHTTAVSRNPKFLQKRMAEAVAFDPIPRMQKYVLSAHAEEIHGLIWNRKECEERFRKILAELNTTEKIIFQRTNAEPGKEDAFLYAEAYQAVKEAWGRSYAEFQKAHRNGSALVAKTVEWNSTPRIGERYKNAPSDSWPSVRNVALREAIAYAFYDALRFDPDVLIFGQDVAQIGDVNCTTALPEEHAAEEDFIKERLPNWKEQVLFGYLPLLPLFPDRILDTPLDEAGIVGTGMGMARRGKRRPARPIMCMQFGGFKRIAEHFFEEYSRMIHQYAGLINMPGVFFLPYGGGERLPYHRAEREMDSLVSNPGLIVAYPCLPQDGYDLLRAMIASDRPGVFMADLDLYRLPRIAELVRRFPTKPIEDFGMRVAQEGKDITVVAYGRLVYESERAVNIVARARKGFSATVLDARILNPLCLDTIIESVKKTGRLVVVQYEPKRYGIGAEIAATIAEELESFPYLQAPIGRVTAPTAHCPPSKFAKFYYPGRKQIARKILETLSF